VKFEPRRGQAVGRVVIKPSRSSILKPDQTKGITKFVLLDAVSPELEAKDIRVGDVVVPFAISNVMLEDGAMFRPIVDDENIKLFVRDWKSLDEFHVQTDNGAAYVPFGDPRAAISLGALSEPKLARPRPENSAEREPSPRLGNGVEREP
jgi:hypothetical protein